MRFIHFAALMGLLTLLAADSSAAAQTTAVEPLPALRAESMLRAADLRADVAILRHAYTALHPGLYRYNTPAQIDAAFRTLDLEFQRDRTLAPDFSRTKMPMHFNSASNDLMRQLI
jgi:hypothetical protein